MKKRLSRLVDYFLSSIYLWLAGIAVLAALFLPKLDSLVPKTIPTEQPVSLGFNSVNAIVNDIVFTPVKAIQFLVLKFIENDVALFRLVSVLAAALSVLLLFLILRNWHTTRIALITSFLYASSSFVLHSARSASPDVMYLLVVPVLVLAGTWIIYKEHDNKLPLSSLLLGTILYVPVSWALLLLAVILFREELSQILKQIPLRQKAISFSIFSVTVTPLIYALATNQSQLVNWLGLKIPDSLTLSVVADRIISIPREIFVTGPTDPQVWLVGSPLLDVFTATVILLGLYAYRIGHHPNREKVVIYGLVAITAILILGSTARLGLLVPLLYLVAANGIAYLLVSWFTVFPRNPFARSIGVILVLAAVATASFYHMHRYYVAWPNSPVTQQSIQK